MSKTLAQCVLKDNKYKCVDFLTVKVNLGHVASGKEILQKTADRKENMLDRFIK